jgi:hypothetical protein
MEAKVCKYVGSWDTEADIVIPGAGGGSGGSDRGGSAGAETVVFEKVSQIWDYSTALSGGTISFAGTDFQMKEGVQDSNDKLCASGLGENLRGSRVPAIQNTDFFKRYFGQE